MIVENVDHVELHFESGDIERYEKVSVKFVKTNTEGDGHKQLHRYYTIVIPIPDEDEEVPSGARRFG